MSKLDNQSMCEVFDIDNISEAKESIQEMKDTLQEIEENVDDDSDRILKNNIDRANRILDILEGDFESGESNPHLFKAAADLIKSITEAASTLASFSFQNFDHDIEEQKLQIKRDELELKRLVMDETKSGGSSNNTINIFTTSDLVNQIKQQREKIINPEYEEIDE